MSSPRIRRALGLLRAQLGPEATPLEDPFAGLAHRGHARVVVSAPLNALEIIRLGASHDLVTLVLVDPSTSPGRGVPAWWGEVVLRRFGDGWALHPRTLAKPAPAGMERARWQRLAQVVTVASALERGDGGAA